MCAFVCVSVCCLQVQTQALKKTDIKREGGERGGDEKRGTAGGEEMKGAEGGGKEEERDGEVKYWNKLCCLTQIKIKY